MFKLKKITLLILLLNVLCANSQEKEVHDKIEKLFELQAKKITKEDKKRNLDKIYNNLTNIKSDTSRKKFYYLLANNYLKIDDSSNFRKFNIKALQYAKNLNDTNYIARSYWDLGNFHRRNQLLDSAYFYYDSSEKLYEELEDQNKVARLLYNMALIQSDVKDYTGSEIVLFEAIKIFLITDDYGRLYNCYNLLGIIHNNLEDYEKAIEYHNDALSYIKKDPSKFSVKKSRTYNNIGVVYGNLGNHEFSVKNYLEALNYDSLYYKSPKLFATLTDNLAYSKFKLNDTTDLPNLFYKALEIRDSLDIPVGIVINKIHLSEYYLSKNDTVKSLQLSTEAMKLAKRIKSYDHLLDSYKLLSKIDKKNDSKYLNEYIQINDSLVKQERTIRNKFTRIRFETDKFITKNKRLNNQITWIVAISTALIFFGFLIYVIKQQRTRNKELEMERRQQRANEEIYNLMIGQQDQIEEGRKREKERISLELHDGILGRLFGTRLSLGSLNAKDDTSSKKSREQYINELQSIEEEVRNISHELGADNFNSTTSYNTMIANLLEEQSKITNFKYQIEDDNRIVWTDIPGHIKINIYRIIQESIHNINKYAQAENVILDFKKNDEHIILTVKDDGVGFDQEKKSNGIGLKNMKSRVALLHGQFLINSIPGKGTSISVDVPMTKNLT